MARVRANFWTGTLSSQLLSGATTLMSAALSTFPTVASPDVAYLVIDPDGSTPEIVKVTAHTSGATTATVVRGQDSTTDRTWAAGTAVAQNTIASDLDTDIVTSVDTLTGDVDLSGSYVAHLSPSGDATGADDVAAVNAAISAATAAGGGTINLAAGAWYINATVTVPDKVNLWGAGDGEESAATRIHCTASGAGIAFGTRGTGHRGGVSGNLCVDGDDTATAPVFIGQAVQRTFINLESYQSAGVGITIEAAQNCTFLGCKSSHAATIAIALDYSAAGNRFFNTECDSAGTWGIVVRQSGTAPAGLNSTPFDNHFYGGIVERVMTDGCVWQDDGDLTGLHDMQLVHDENDATFSHVKVDTGQLTVDGGLIQSNNAGQGTAVTVASGATAHLNGAPVINGVSVALSNSGTININGHLNVVSASTYLSGTAPVRAIDYGYGSLGSIPVYAAGSSTPGTSLGAVAASWWCLDPDHWPSAPDGRTLQYRAVATFEGFTDGDVGGMLLYDTVGAAGMFAEVTDTKVSGSPTVQVASGWQTFPASIKGGYVMTRNQTASRGTNLSCFIEVRIA